MQHRRVVIFIALMVTLALLGVVRVSPSYAQCTPSDGTAAGDTIDCVTPGSGGVSGRAGNDTINVNSGSFTLIAGDQNASGGNDNVFVNEGATVTQQVAGDGITTSSTPGTELIVINGSSLAVYGDHGENTAGADLTGNGGADTLIVTYGGTVSTLVGDNFSTGTGGSDTIIVYGTVGNIYGDNQVGASAGNLDNVYLGMGLTSGVSSAITASGQYTAPVTNTSAFAGATVTGSVFGGNGNDNFYVFAGQNVLGTLVPGSQVVVNGTVNGEAGTNNLYLFVTVDDPTQMGAILADTSVGGQVTINGVTYLVAGIAAGNVYSETVADQTTDSDGDGVPNWTDACDTTPGPGQPNGCPAPVVTPTDADGDGFPDTTTDQCPGVFGTLNGCPEPQVGGSGTGSTGTGGSTGGSTGASSSGLILIVQLIPVGNVQVFIGNALVGSSLRSLGSIRIRDNASLNGHVLGQVPWGALVVVLGEDSSKEWIRIRYNGIEGWAASDWFVLPNGGSLYTLASILEFNRPVPANGARAIGTVNIRVSPNLTAAIKGQVPWGYRVVVLDEDATGLWWEIEYNGIRGWVANEWFTTPDGFIYRPFEGGRRADAVPLSETLVYMTSSPVSAKTAVATAGVRMRIEPSLNSLAFSRVIYGGTVQVLGGDSSGDWWLVNYNGVVGWVFNAYFDVVQ